MLLFYATIQTKQVSFYELYQGYALAAPGGPWPLLLLLSDWKILLFRRNPMLYTLDFTGSGRAVGSLQFFLELSLV